MQKALPRLLLAACALIAALCLALAAGLFDAPQRKVMALAPVPTAGQPVAVQASGGININTATEKELQQLPGIGPHLAQQIIQARQKSPFFYPEDLKNVPGIGDRRLTQIRPYIRLD